VEKSQTALGKKDNELRDLKSKQDL